MNLRMTAPSRMSSSRIECIFARAANWLAASGGRTEPSGLSSPLSNAGSVTVVCASCPIELLAALI